jgi:hypothetical protein
MLPILDIFPIEDGIVIKTLFDRSLLYYEVPKPNTSHTGDRLADALNRVAGSDSS